MLSHSRSSEEDLGLSLNECEQLPWFFSLGCYDHGSAGELLQPPWFHLFYEGYSSELSYPRESLKSQ